MTNRHWQGILLAAGSSRRFAGDKLLAPLANGEPMALVAARTLLEVLPDSLAVIRPDQSALREQLERTGIRIVTSAEARDGMGYSLAAGVRASAGADGWLVALADMPWLQAATLRMLVEALDSGSPLVAPVFAGRRGHPVGFSAPFGTALQALGGDQGARTLLERHADELHRLAVNDPGVVRDVDTRADLDPELKRALPSVTNAS